ncbi:MAG TPA: hypothetical protein VFU06_00045 [Longimicrobiales bacterium]|nr:hypothetical protein [Longimicrobiales bacterium]
MIVLLYCVVVLVVYLALGMVAAILGGYEAQRDNAEDVRLGLRKEAR